MSVKGDQVRRLQFVSTLWFVSELKEDLCLGRILCSPLMIQELYKRIRTRQKRETDRGEERFSGCTNIKSKNKDISDIT